MPETASCSVGSRRFGELRGVQWRVDLGILPSPPASIDDIRRVTANSRRRYAALRKQLLVDPHVPKDGNSSPDPVMDNPLSQNPDSMWGRFFRNAELERMVDQDLTRLYPERGSYFQTSGCQGMLRRILLLWCLSHPEYGYRQGMHELLAPLLYVLHVDVEHLAEVRKVHEDHFADNFDGFSYHENDLTYKFDFKKFSESVGDGGDFDKSSVKATNSLTELDPVIQTVVLLSDAYGAEGELGIVLSEKFIEHDAYSMFDALMSGAGGVVAMALFFSPYGSSQTGFTPVIEASAAMYHLLSLVDSSLHSHLVELGVEPQYFSLRWLRVLFGREFSLEDLLVIWDEIFACYNMKSKNAADSNAESNFGVLDSPRGAFISAFAVSMILKLRSSLLATENATACLQRLLNFPDVNLAKLVAKAKSLHALAIEVNNSNSLLVHPGLYDGRKPVIIRGNTLSLDSTSARTPLVVVPESYWEEKWRVLHREEEQKQGGAGEEQLPSIRKCFSKRERTHLSRTESDPYPPKKNGSTKITTPSVRRSLLEDLARQLGSDENKENTGCNDVKNQNPVEVNGGQDVAHPSPSKETESTKTPKPSIRRSLLADLAQQLGSDENKENTGCNDVKNHNAVEVNGQDLADKKLDSMLSGAESEGNFPNFSDPPSPFHGNIDRENESERSSVGSNSSIGENDAASCATNPECHPILVSDTLDCLSPKFTKNDDSMGKSATGMKERKILSSKFHWLRKFGRTAREGASERAGASEDAKTCDNGSGQNNVAGFSTAGRCSSSGTSKGETVDQNLGVSLKNLGQSMLENIQVIESVVQQNCGQIGQPENLSKNGFVGKGQVTAMSALEELRKISYLLSEM